jgi:pimeloyl-ACP methyl ester carboxylesterase
MANIILVAGTFHGGWYWDPIVPGLAAAGHAVYAPTLSGLDSADLTAGPINLDSHIDDVLRVIDENKLAEVVLVGWSYGGVVITGVSDRTAAKVEKLIYLDGQLPNPGQREWDLLPPADQASTLASCLDGLNIYPDEWLLEYEPRTQPHPLGTKLQPLDYDQGKFDALDKVFIYAERWFHNPEVTSPLEPSYLRAKGAIGWRTEAWPFGHDLVREAAAEVESLLIKESPIK